MAETPDVDGEVSWIFLFYCFLSRQLQGEIPKFETDFLKSSTLVTVEVELEICCELFESAEVRRFRSHGGDLCLGAEYHGDLDLGIASPES